MKDYSPLKNDPKKTVENTSRTHMDSSGNKQASCIQLPEKTLPSPTGNSKKNTLGSVLRVAWEQAENAHTWASPQILGMRG